MRQNQAYGRALLTAMLILAAIPLQAAETIHADKLSPSDLRAAIEKASDDTVVEFGGQSKTKAQLRRDFQAAHKPPDAARMKAIAEAQRAETDAIAKALADKQEEAVAGENARATAEFEKLKAR